MALSLPPCPSSLRPIQHFLKLATEHDSRDSVVSYWARITALQNGLELDKSSPEALAILLPLMEWLEGQKQIHKDNDAVVNEIVASAHIENYAMKLFLYADRCDRAAQFGKNVVKSFYSAGVLFDVMESFGEVSPEVAHYNKYAKMKAAYIHNCLKNGETPIAGPLTGDDEDDQEEKPPAEEDTAARPEPDQPTQPEPDTPPSSHRGFVAAEPSVQPSIPSQSGVATLSIDQVSRAQKLCKYAISALDYQDTKTAIENLTAALILCQTGQEPA